MPSMTLDYFIQRIAFLLAGRLAEYMYSGKLEAGASNDIDKATELATNVVSKYGLIDDFSTFRAYPLGKKDSIIVKVSKPNQDKRFDIPAFGLNTLKTMKKYKSNLIAVEANETILVDKAKTIEFADKNNIVVMAV